MSRTFVTNEVIQEYMNGNGAVHFILSNAIKAFDCVNYVSLSSQLINKELCPLVFFFYLHVAQTDPGGLPSL